MPLATVSQSAHGRPPAALWPSSQVSIHETELRTSSVEFIFQVRFLDASISFPSPTNVVEGFFFLILLKNAIKFVSWNLLFKNPDSCLLMEALCSWFLRIFFFISIPLLYWGLKTGLPDGKCQDLFPPPPLIQKTRIISAIIHSPGSSIQLLEETAIVFLRIH